MKRFDFEQLPNVSKSKINSFTICKGKFSGSCKIVAVRLIEASNLPFQASIINSEDEVKSHMPRLQRVTYCINKLGAALALSASFLIWGKGPQG